MLARGSASEIATGDQDRGVAIAGQVQFELGIGIAILMESPVEKEILSEARAFDPLEELLGDDLVGIDVGTVHRRRDS